MKVTDYERVNSVQDSDVLLIDGNRGTKTILVKDLHLGNTILDEDGETYPKRSKLQFNGAKVLDDETNDATVVETVNPVDYEEDIYGVNLFKPNFTTKTENGITYTVNSDNSISTSGTTTADTRTELGKVYLVKGTYILSGNPYIFDASANTIRLRLYNSSDSKIFWDDGNGITFTIDSSEEYTLAIRYGSGAVFGSTFHPMLRKATIKDDTYRPYNHQAIQHQLTDQTNVLGAKNLIPYPYSQTTKTESGITFIDNGDGSITVNGTATASVYMTLFSQSGTNFILPKGSYTGSGCPSGGSDSTYQIRFQRVPSNTYMYKDKGNGVDFEFTEAQQCGVYIFIYSGATLSNVTFKPMLRLASDPDDTYVPYAKTNRELTEALPFKLGIDANGNYGYIKAGADSVTPFKSGSVAYSINTSGRAPSTRVNRRSFISKTIALSLPSTKPAIVQGKLTVTFYQADTSLYACILTSGGTTLGGGTSSGTYSFNGLLPANQVLRISIQGIRENYTILENVYCDYQLTESYAIPYDSTTTEGVVWSVS